MAILQKTSAITAQVLDALRQAQSEIFFQMYYVDDDSIFTEYAKILADKALQGVKVHCLFDALGSSQIPGSNVEKRLLDAGVHIQYFNWLTPWANNNKRILYFRNHKRTLIIDKKIVHTGGWCIGDKTENWIDGYITSSDPEVVEAGIRDFWNMYTYAHKTQLRFKHQKKYVYNPQKNISYTYQSPLPQGRFIYYAYKKLINSAKKRIVFIVPYFAPVYILKRAIYQARKRGLEISLYMPKKTDSKLVDLVGRTYIYNLLKNGVSVYLSDVMVHAKVSIFDDTLYVGSLNLDSVSLRYNFENGIYTKDISAIQTFEQDLITFKNSCQHITFEMWQQRSLWEKFLDRFMKLFRAFV